MTVAVLTLTNEESAAISRQEREEDARWAERARVVMDEIEDDEVAEINRELDKERG